MSTQAQWKARPEGGGRLPIRAIGLMARHAGRGVTRLLLYPITLYFLLVRGVERRASRDYLTRLLGRPATLWQAARHVHCFASTILDRVFMLGGRMGLFQIRTEGLDALQTELDKGRGVLLFGAHLGSFDALRALGRERPDIQIRVLLDVAHNAAITELMSELDPSLAAGIIDAGQEGTAIVLAIAQALEQGALVALLVDRARPGDVAIEVPLLGSPAPMPAAPWLIASTLKVPVMLAFGLYEGGNRYRMVFEPFAETIDIPRRERAQALPRLIGRYAGRLEHHLRQLPYNWFNFYDFWHAQGISTRAVADPAGPVGQPADGQRVRT